MSSRLFRTKMAMTNRPPVYPELLVAGGSASVLYYEFYKYDTQGNFSAFRGISDLIYYVNAVAVRSDGKFVALGLGNSTLALYRRSNGGFTRVALFTCSFSPTAMHFSNDFKYLMAFGDGSSAGQNIFVCAPDDTSYTVGATSLNAPLASNHAISARPSPNGTYLAAAFNGNTPYLALYKNDGTGAFKTSLGAVAGVTNNFYVDVAWSPDSKYIAAAMSNSSNNLYLAQVNADDTTTKILSLSGTGLGLGTCVEFSPDGQHLAQGISNVVPYYNIFKFDGAALTKLSVPAINVKPKRIRYSPDGKYVALVGTVLTTGDPSVCILQRSGDTYTVLTQLEAGQAASHNDVVWGPPPL